MRSPVNLRLGLVGYYGSESVNIEEDSVETVDTSLGVTVKKDEDFGQWYS
ncbi:hypothetical protein F2Q68_00045231 [Brassica cretica]|uniref:Uncharacterized protein n=1 Tax=Brassica cretica TaxID=69181 RepID=A0A8S9LML8_BRACR|nr:hypothetical protein F2Q68_00045231 [Brassica cretica]